MQFKKNYVNIIINNIADYISLIIKNRQNEIKICNPLITSFVKFFSIKL
jgi:hypothetical protein